jgi:hypothetical protein
MARARKSRSVKAAPSKRINVRDLKPLMVAINRVLKEVGRQKSASSPSIDQLQAEYDAMEECCCQRAHVVSLQFRK